jgi:hypothetical protein
MATYKATKTHLSLRMTEREAVLLLEILARSTQPGALQFYSQVNNGLGSMNLKQRFAAPSVTDPRD